MAWDEFAATHDKDNLGGALQVPGETNTDTDAEKLTGIALAIMDNLIKEAGTHIENPEYSTIETQIGEYAQEL